MKKHQNSKIAKVKKVGVQEAKSVIRAGAAHHRAEAAPRSAGIHYSDALIEVYHQEEKDINRFAAFARTLMEK